MTVPSMRGKGAIAFRIAAVAIASLISLRFGRRSLAVLFNSYDDEGYCLISLSHYFSGGHLYTEVFTQYGPFYFFAERALFALFHLPATHDAGRLITLVLWLFSAALGGIFLYRISKSISWGVFAGLLIMFAGRVLANEPNHPQQIVLPLMIMGCCAAAFAGDSGLLLMGAVGAALSFTKINVGVFYFEAIALTVVCGLRASRLRKVCAALLLIFLSLFPLQLMHRDLPGWANGFALLAVLGGVSTFVAGLQTSPPLPRLPRIVLRLAVGAIAATLIIAGGVFLQGMSPATLLDGVILTPLRHPSVFEIPLVVHRTQALAGLLELICIAAIFLFRDRWSSSAVVIDVLHVAAGATVIYQTIFSGLPQPNLICLLPVGLLSPGRRTWEPFECFPRMFVASLAAAQFLQMYPVAGSQIFISYTPLLLWSVVCLSDGINGLVFSLPTVFPFDGISDWILQGRRIITWSSALVFMLLLQHRSDKIPADANPASSLRGSHSMHLSSSDEQLYEDLANTIHANCDVLFTMPGMASLNFWSGVPTPNGFNHNAWMRTLSLDQQQETLRTLQTNPGACVVYNPKLLSLWEVPSAELNTIPLARYVLYDMRKVWQEKDYDIRVAPDRNSTWKPILHDSHFVSNESN